MKMSDVFKVDRDIDIDDCDLFNLDEMGAAAHAINKHDALVAMNAELVKALELVLNIAETEKATEYMIEMTLRKAKELNQ